MNPYKITKELYSHTKFKYIYIYILFNMNFHCCIKYFLIIKKAFALRSYVKLNRGKGDTCEYHSF